MIADNVFAQIHYHATQEVRDIIAAIGRTEDVKFSPNNRRIAVAGFIENKFAVFAISIAASDNSKSITLTSAVEISSDHLKGPHGLDFIDDKRILVANRYGQACIFEVPLDITGKHELTPLLVLGSEHISGPGSVAVFKNQEGIYEALICNNFGHCVTRHLLDLKAERVTEKSDVIFKKWLESPDGVSFSGQMRWIAISNHDTHTVLLYESCDSLNGSSDPDGILRCAIYPHGLKFTSDDRFILVADAGSPYVHIYEKDDAEWRGVRNPVLSLRVLNDQDYFSGRYSPEEGGAKGIDINDAENILVTTCEKQPLGFFDLTAVLEGATSQGNLQKTRQQKMLEVAYELTVQKQAKAKILYFENSRSWLITAPLRWVFAILRILAHWLPRPTSAARDRSLSVVSRRKNITD
jgi:hypothetical protein